jgi:hypothetical protein
MSEIMHVKGIPSPVKHVTFSCDYNNLKHNQSAEGTAVGTYEGSKNYFFYFGADNSMSEGCCRLINIKCTIQ